MDAGGFFEVVAGVEDFGAVPEGDVPVTLLSRMVSKKRSPMEHEWVNVARSNDNKA